MKKWFSCVVILLAVLYRDSFTAPFFQDDKILLELSKGPVFSLIPNFPFRPVSIQIFYGFSRIVFGYHPLGYHFVLFLAFVTALVFVYKLGEMVLKSREKSLAAVIFYAFNVSLFANFYWIAVSYFTLGAMFFFGGVWFYFQKEKWKKAASYVFFILALGSNELAIMTPVILAAASWYLRRWQKDLIWLGAIDGLLLIVRYIYVGLPKYGQYAIRLDPQVLATFRWYLLRVFNLPEGIRFSGNILLVLLFIVFVGLVLFGILKNWNWRVFLLTVSWLILGALPFYFLPNHMSSYYLTIAMFGPALFFAKVLSARRILITGIIVYLLMTIIGLDFLRHTHWIILKNTGPIGQFTTL